MIGEIALTVAFGTSLVVLLSAWYKHHKRRQIINKIPGLSGFPLIGDSLNLKSDSLGFYQQVFEYCQENTDKGIFKLWMGSETMIFVFRVNTVEVLFNTKKHTTKGFSYWFLKPWLHDGLLLSDGEKWLERRRLITPTFHFKILEEFMNVFNEQGKILLEILETKASGPAFDFQPFIYRCMLDTIRETAMGVKVNAQKHYDSDFVSAIYRESELIINRMKFPWLWNRHVYFHLTPIGREDAACIRTLHGFTSKVIRERIEERKQKKRDNMEELSSNKSGQNSREEADNIYTTSKRKRMAFVDMLLSTAESNESMTAEGIQEEVDTFMFEGHDTTASGTVWILYMLACHPELQEKVQQEIDSIFGDKETSHDLTIEDINKLQYTECFIKETFRLYPPVPWFSRTTTEPCNIGGYDIPEGNTVTVFTQLLHRDPEYFPEPEVFNPDRWLLENSSSSRHPYCYVPFSAGFRNCIGQRFAMIEIKVMISHLMSHFTVSCSFDREALTPMATLILKPAEALPVKFSRRQVKE